MKTTYEQRVEAAKVLGDQMIQREIDRCRAQMGEFNWQDHSSWVIENIVAAAKVWLARELKEGRL